MTREEAIKNLHQCERCKRWITVTDCDHCWVDRHKCPPTVKAALEAANRAIEIGKEAEQIKRKILDAWRD